MNKSWLHEAIEALGDEQAARTEVMNALAETKKLGKKWMTVVHFVDRTNKPLSGFALHDSESIARQFASSQIERGGSVSVPGSGLSRFYPAHRVLEVEVQEVEVEE